MNKKNAPEKKRKKKKKEDGWMDGCVVLKSHRLLLFFIFIFQPRIFIFIFYCFLIFFQVQVTVNSEEASSTFIPLTTSTMSLLRWIGVNNSTNSSSAPSGSRQLTPDPSKDQWWARSGEKYFGMENVSLSFSEADPTQGNIILPIDRLFDLLSSEIHGQSICLSVMPTIH